MPEWASSHYFCRGTCELACQEYLIVGLSVDSFSSSFKPDTLWSA
jgi:hypothetical protein